MNINDVEVRNEEIPETSSEEFWENFMDLRKLRFHGFCAIENENEGIVQPQVSLSTAKGQEAFRILSFRILEELAEALNSHDEDHYFEELADALNYLLSIPFLDHDVVSVDKIVRILHLSALVEGAFKNDRLTAEDLGRITLTLGVQIGDKLRNRAWTATPQDFYFDGQTELLSGLQSIVKLIFASFIHFRSLAWYLIAKDKVLKFRLETNY